MIDEGEVGMKIYKVGDTSKAVCHNCKAVKPTTFQLRDIPFSDGEGVVKNVIAGVCDICNEVVSTPPQSTPNIKKSIEEKRKPVEARVPAHMIDILNCASYDLSGTVDFVPAMLKFYIHKMSSNDKVVSPSKLGQFLNSELATGKNVKRISIKGGKIVKDIDALKGLTKIESTTDIIKSVVLKINNDILTKKNKRVIKQLKDVAASTL